MQAVKAIYKEGNVHLLTPILDIDEAELCVIVLDKNTQSDDIEQFAKTLDTDAIKDFQAIGMEQFFSMENGSDVDPTEWEYNMTANKPS